MTARYVAVRRLRESGFWPAVLDTERHELCGLITEQGARDITAALNDGSLSRECLRGWRTDVPPTVAATAAALTMLEQIGADE